MVSVLLELFGLLMLQFVLLCIIKVEKVFSEVVIRLVSFMVQECCDDQLVQELLFIRWILILCGLSSRCVLLIGGCDFMFDSVISVMQVFSVNRNSFYIRVVVRCLWFDGVLVMVGVGGGVVVLGRGIEMLDGVLVVGGVGMVVDGEGVSVFIDGVSFFFFLVYQIIGIVSLYFCLGIVVMYLRLMLLLFLSDLCSLEIFCVMMWLVIMFWVQMFLISLFWLSIFFGWWVKKIRRLIKCGLRVSWCFFLLIWFIEGVISYLLM